MLGLIPGDLGICLEERFALSGKKLFERPGNIKHQNRRPRC